MIETGLIVGLLNCKPLGVPLPFAGEFHHRHFRQHEVGQSRPVIVRSAHLNAEADSLIEASCQIEHELPVVGEVETAGALLDFSPCWSQVQLLSEWDAG